MSINPILGYQGGLRTGRGSTPRAIFWGGTKAYRPGGGLIDCVKTRDVLNTDSQLALRAGLLMGLVTATGRWANCYAGLSNAAYTATATSLTLTLTTAAELLRRNGATGSLSLIGPPTANADAVTNQTLAYSAIDTATGVVTVTGTGTTASVSGSLIGFADGSQVPDSFLDDGNPFLVATTAAGTDVTGGTIGWPSIPNHGMVDESYFLPLPTDLGILKWLRRNLNGDPTTGPGKNTFTFKGALAA